MDVVNGMQWIFEDISNAKDDRVANIIKSWPALAWRCD
jgi:hypothetical protein